MNPLVMLSKEWNEKTYRKSRPSQLSCRHFQVAIQESLEEIKSKLNTTWWQLMTASQTK